MVEIDFLEVATYLGVSESPFLKDVTKVAAAMVEQYLKGCRAVPEEIVKYAVIVTAAELYHRKDAPNGVKAFSDLDGAPIRLASKAFKTSGKPILEDYRKLGFA